MTRLTVEQRLRMSQDRMRVMIAEAMVRRDAYLNIGWPNTVAHYEGQVDALAEALIYLEEDMTIDEVKDRGAADYPAMLVKLIGQHERIVAGLGSRCAAAQVLDALRAVEAAREVKVSS